MYVNPFWFGVIATIAAEIAILMFAALWYGGKK